MRQWVFIVLSKISRIDYKKPANPGPVTDFDVIIKDDIEIDEAFGKILGTIKIGDTGFSVHCNKDIVLQILREEACALNADMIVLKDVKEPDFFSSCFRVTAYFVKLNEGIEKSSFRSSAKYVQ